MSIKLENFKTDFTEFLNSNLPHTVKVVTDNKILECSSILLSQHSSILKDMISKDNEIFMLDYQFVEDLLVLLYGGSVELSLENCLEFIKFACQFKITGVVEQVFNFLSSVVDESNLVSVVRVCVGAIKAAKFFEFKPYDSEFFFAGEEVLKEMNRDEILTFVDDFQAEEVFVMFANRVFVKQILPVSKRFITQDNGESVIHSLLILEDFVDSAALCSFEDLTEFFFAFEELSLTAKTCRNLQNLKKSVYKQFSLDEVMTDIAKPSTDSSLFTKSLKCWRQYSAETMCLLCKYGSNGFYLIEIILSWVDFKRPTLSTIKRLLSYIDLTKLPSKYLEHIQEMMLNLGYWVDLEPGKGRSTSPSSENTIDRIEIKSKDDGPAVRITFSSSPSPVINVTGNTGPTELLKFSNGNRWSEHVVYGTGIDGKHIPFYADPYVACRMIGCDRPILEFFKLVQ